VPDTIYFAIGDIHGEARKLAALHDAILDRIAFEGRPACIVHLGDYVDRGPDSRGVIDRIMRLERKFAGSASVQVISVMGNHEQMMLDAFDADPDTSDLSWWTEGGTETAASYAGAADRNWRAHIPRDHVAWMRALPVIHRVPDRKLVFVHAGIEPSSFPGEADGVYLWTRSDRFFNDNNWPQRPELEGLTVVHGHTPVGPDPDVGFRRINVDTGACFGGPLTAAMLKPDASPQFLRVR
jgi:serine/threonine protein phosphatase 1